MEDSPVVREYLQLLHERRSYRQLVEPAPTSDEVKLILDAAAAAPDHGKLRPWRFFVLNGDDKKAFGDVMVQAYNDRCRRTGRDVEPAVAEKQRTKLDMAPLIIAVAAVRQQNPRIGWLEQVSSASAAAQNICLAATALGYGSMWRTGEAVTEPAVKEAFGLAEPDAIIGFVYLGTIPEGAVSPAARPGADDVSLWWKPKP